jgi:hypothetical protein
LLLVGGVSLNIRQLVGINRVPQKKCDHLVCLQPQSNIRCLRTLRRGP